MNYTIDPGPNPLARYPELKLFQLQRLADSGVACLAISPGCTADSQRDLLANAIARFKAREITAGQYRHKLIMIINHCRRKVYEVWAYSPNQKPQVASFLRVCRTEESELFEL